MQRLTQVFTTCRAIEAAQRERIAEASGADEMVSDDSSEALVSPGRLQNMVRAFPLVASLLVGVIMVVGQYAGVRVPLYPFQDSPCAPCRCDDGRLVACPDGLDDVGATALELQNKGENFEG